MGYSSSKTLLPRHWFQFADDSAITTSTEKDNQLPLNMFSKWCDLAGLIICVDKCSTFRIKKNGNSSTQFKPYLKINSEVIPRAKLNETFTYLRKTFSYTMSVGKVKSELISDFNSYTDTVNRLLLHPKNKLNIITRYNYRKVRWRFSIYKLGKTWAKQNPDPIIKEYVKRSLRLPRNDTLSHLYLPTKHLGLKFSLPSDIYACYQLSTTLILKTSRNLEIELTKHKFIKEDVIANKTNK